MKFKINGLEWIIKEVEQDDFREHDGKTKEEGMFFGQSHFDTQEIWLWEKASEEQKRKTLYHELMHVYIKSYITFNDLSFDEEGVCDLSANSHKIIHKIAKDYFKWKDSEETELPRLKDKKD